MKLKFKIALLLVVIACTAVAEEFTREIHQGYAKSAIQALKVVNKYGEVRINDMGGDSITVDVTITVESSVENKAEYLLQQIEIDMQKRGSLLSLETDIKESFKSKQDFTIDYLINIPSDRDLMISNKFGNIIVASLQAKGEFEIDYGYLHTGEMIAPDENPIKIILGYGKADLESFNNAICEVRYSKLIIGEADKLVANSKYSTINAEEIGILELESKYDGIKIEELNELKARSKYTNYDIEELAKSFELETEYGSVRIEEVNQGFELIDLTNSYGGISIGFSDLAFMLRAECDYCDVRLLDHEFSGTRSKDGHHLSLDGTVGSRTATGKVKIRSRYGGVKLTD